MPVDEIKYKGILAELGSSVRLVAVSKKKTIEEIQALYHLGQRDFGENYVQELAEKQAVLPKDIRWHFIGHLQTNKIKVITPFVHLIQGVDSIRLLKEINKQGAKESRQINCLLQVHIAIEETKFGFDPQELAMALELVSQNSTSFVRIRGLMGMASFSHDEERIRQEFKALKQQFDRLALQPELNAEPLILSMGMSADYQVAVQEGSNMVRIGSLIFGER